MAALGLALREDFLSLQLVEAALRCGAGFLIVADGLVEEYGPQGTRASAVVAHRLRA